MYLRAKDASGSIGEEEGFSTAVVCTCIEIIAVVTRPRRAPKKQDPLMLGG